jgi:hypothetical protein
MKKKIILMSCILLSTVQFVNAQLKVIGNGNVGINTSTPTYRLDVEGTGRFSGWTDVMIDWTGDWTGACIYPQYDVYLQLGKAKKRLNCIYTENIRITNLTNISDDSIKTNKRSIDNPIAIINGLQGKKYNYTTDYLLAAPDSFYQRQQLARDQYGFMAREVLNVLPEIVTYDSAAELYGVNYIQIIPILTEAIKAQQSSITGLQNQITQLTQTVTELQNCCDNGAGKIQQKRNEDTYNFQNMNETSLNKKSNLAALYQNNPNPFNDKTEIKFYLPNTTTNAKLIIYNLNGQQLNAIKINNNGQGLQSIFIDGGNLSAGSYYYTLLVDNKEVDTKKMILLK